MPDMHPSARRLYAAAEQLSPPARTQSELARALGASPQTVNNWETRGVSSTGANEAQRRHGISSTWVLDGVMPMFVTEGSPKSQSPRLEADNMRAAMKLMDHIRDFAVDPIPEDRVEDLSIGIAEAVLEFGAAAILDGSAIVPAARKVIAGIRGR